MLSQLSSILRDASSLLQSRWSGYLKAIAVCIATAILMGIVITVLSSIFLKEFLLEHGQQSPSFFATPMLGVLSILHAVVVCSIVYVTIWGDSLVTYQLLLRFISRNVLRMIFAYIIYYVLTFLPSIILTASGDQSMSMIAVTVSIMISIVLAFFDLHILLNRFGIIRAIIESYKSVRKNMADVIILVVSAHIITSILLSVFNKNLIVILFTLGIAIFLKITLICIFLRSHDYLDLKK